MRKNDRKNIQPGLKLTVKNRMDELHEFFQVHNMETLSTKWKTKLVEQRTVILCATVKGLIRYINARRNVNETVLKVGIDGGQGSLKIVLSIEERNRELKQRLKDSGARRAFIIGLAPGMQENYTNIANLWHRLELNSIESSFAGMV